MTTGFRDLEDWVNIILQMEKKVQYTERQKKIFSNNDNCQIPLHAFLVPARFCLFNNYFFIVLSNYFWNMWNFTCDDKLYFLSLVSWDCLLSKLSDAADTVIHLFMFAAQITLNSWHKILMRSNVMMHERVKIRAIILISRQVICKLRWASG